MRRNRKTKPELHKLRRALKIKPLSETVQEEVILAMKAAEGDKILAAALLGISKTTVYRKLQERRRPLR